MEKMRTDITIAFHLGAPKTDNEQLTRSLRKDDVLLSKSGVLVQTPKIYRPLLSEATNKLQGSKASTAEQEKMLDAIIGDHKVGRLILSNSNFLGVPAWMFFGGLFYKQAGRNTQSIRNLFPDNPCEFFLGISNPASFIPAAFKMQKTKSYHEFMDGIGLAKVRWSDVIKNIQKANLDCKVTAWCNEDTPIIWPDVLTEIAGLDALTELSGGMDIINKIISDDGGELLAEHLADHPNLSDPQRRQVKGVFLEKYYLEDEVDEIIDLPGWTDETVEALTENYDEDVQKIEQMPGVKFLLS